MTQLSQHFWYKWGNCFELNRFSTNDVERCHMNTAQSWDRLFYCETLFDYLWQLTWQIWHIIVAFCCDHKIHWKYYWVPLQFDCLIAVYTGAFSVPTALSHPPPPLLQQTQNYCTNYTETEATISLCLMLDNMPDMAKNLAMVHFYIKFRFLLQICWWING